VIWGNNRHSVSLSDVIFVRYQGFSSISQLSKWYWFNQWLSQQSCESCIIDFQIKPKKYLLCNHAKTNFSKGILIKEWVKKANDILILNKILPWIVIPQTLPWIMIPQTLPWIVIPHSHHLECKVLFLHQNDVFLPL
jgi:hypothetical protein